MRHVVVMVTTSYPRFPGDLTGTFMEPIARGVAARGHEVHVVAPWHPLITRADVEQGIHFHFFRYAPVAGLNVFGYAAALEADERLRPSALLMTPAAVAAGCLATARVVRRTAATIVHGHWVVPGGFIAAHAVPRSTPLVVSLHGSDLFVAERHRLIRRAAGGVFRRAARVTACSLDLARRAIAIGANPDSTEVLPYGVDTTRFAPDKTVRQRVRADLGVADDVPVILSAGRLVRKKGFEFLIDAAGLIMRQRPEAIVLIAGSGDLDEELRRKTSELGPPGHVRFLGAVSQDAIPGLLAAADVAVVPSVHDAAGNVDGLPNIVMEALASGTALVATEVGGIGAVVRDRETGLIVPERDGAALARAIMALLDDRDARLALGRAARTDVCLRHTWERFAERLEQIYDAVRNVAHARPVTVC